MRRVLFENDALSEFTGWASENKKIFDRIVRLIDETRRTPFEGTGKPELLRFNYKGCWSRRITDEHRLIYKVAEDLITIISCKYHYQ